MRLYVEELIVMQQKIKQLYQQADIRAIPDNDID